ncbi:glycosyltransferase [Solirubrobacter ginsenosidimutans]|uniref:Glycosyltransferase n=1 Tax=Solirubrobacter ginsenosidimutans TaxID=490573 RepID=A0A9X3N303_9ACTN|nr:glycosyltransferase [Solirubrobacter ginsenosidimutans]MDA0167322.1 glycosyltransferase [Solirubrobacter ginsenosidimutans]
MPRVDVLIVSLGGTAGLREADAELAASLRRAGALVEIARVGRARELRTFAAIEFAWAVNARRATMRAVADLSPRAVIYSTTTAALLGPVSGAIRFDAPAAGNRPGRHGIWQRPVEARRFKAAPLLLPWSEGGLAEAPVPHADAVIVPMPVEPSGPAGERDIAAMTYGANPDKKGLDTVLEAWSVESREGEELIVAGLDEAAGAPWLARAREAARAVFARHGVTPPWDGGEISAPGGGSVRFAGLIPRDEYRALLRRTRVFLSAPRREDYGIAQLEALADGCVLVTTNAPGPYVALPIARGLDNRLVGPRLAIRAALDAPKPDYATRAATALAPFTRAAVDRVVAEQLLPRLMP